MKVLYKRLTLVALGVILGIFLMVGCADQSDEQNKKSKHAANDEEVDKIIESVGVTTVDESKIEKSDRGPTKPGTLLTEKELLAAFPQKERSLAELVKLIDDELQQYPLEKIESFPGYIFGKHRAAFAKCGVVDFGLFGREYLFTISSETVEGEQQWNGYAFSELYDIEPHGKTFHPRNGTVVMLRKRIQGKWYLFWDSAASKHD